MKLYLFASMVLAVLLAAPSGHAIGVYTMKKQPKLVKNLDDAAFAKNESSYVAKDPNFTDRPAAKFSGVALEALVRGMKIVPEEVFTFICKDAYLYADTLKALLASGAMIANKIDDQVVPDRFGGPIALIHKQEVEKDRYPWYIDAIVIGDVLSPNLSVTLGQEPSRDVKWNALSKLPGNVSKLMVFPSPRGRRLNGLDGSSVRSKISYLPLKSLVSIPKAAGYSLTYKTFSDRDTSREIVEKDLNQMSVVWQRNGKEIPAYEGGPFIVFMVGEDRDMKPAFHVTSIKVTPKK